MFHGNWIEYKLMGCFINSIWTFQWMQVKALYVRKLELVWVCGEIEINIWNEQCIKNHSENRKTSGTNKFPMEQTDVHPSEF